MARYDFAKYIKNSRTSGDQLNGCSPFRDDNNPSFSANVTSGLWIDHGTGESGNWDGFLKKLGRSDDKIPKKRSWKKTATYIYNDELGRPALRIERLEDSETGEKIFPQSHLANGKWVKGKPSSAVTPFCYSDWSNTSDLVFFVEGEKCALRLAQLGLKATTSHGGSSVRKLDYLQKYFVSRTVCVIPDNDHVGKQFAIRVASTLSDVATVKVIELPGLASGEDVVEWLDRGHSKDDLLSLFTAGSIWKKEAREDSSVSIESGSPLATAEEYFGFFEHHLNNPKRDILSGDLLTKVEGIWQPATSRLDYLGSYAYDSYAFKKTRLKEHLARFTETKKPQLLVEIPEWDKVDRIREISNRIQFSNCTSDHFYELFCDWGAKLFRRIDNPKIQNRVIVFQGSQGVGKDYLINSIIEGFDQFAADLTITDNERDTQATLGNLVVAKISEFDRTSKTDVSTIKDLITRDHTYIRLPYDRSPKRRLLRCSFIASVNVSDVLRDHTGNRRFIIFNIEKIDWGYPKGESLQILAQFKYLAQTGFEPSVEAERVMKSYIESQTPDDSQVAVLEVFDDRIKTMESLGKVSFSLPEITPVVADIGRIFGWKTNKILNLLKANGRSNRKNTGMEYFRLR